MTPIYYWKIFFAMFFIFLLIGLTSPILTHLQTIGFGFTQTAIHNLQYYFIALIIGMVLLFIILF